MRVEDLSVNERILTHLSDYRFDPERATASIAQTQECISEAVGIRINHVPRATKKLLDDNYIEAALVHIGGLKRKRKAYFLTESGSKITEKIISKVRGQKVLFRSADGAESTLKIEEVIFRSGSKVSISKIILTAFNEGLVQASALAEQERPPYLSTLDAVPEPAHFFGREVECDRLKNNLEGDERIIVVSGMRGIGKTSLVRTVLKGYEDSRNILWYVAHEWDTARSMLESLAEFFIRLERNELKKLLRTTKKMDINLAVSTLMRDILASNTILVMDNIFDLKEEVMQLLYMICESSRNLQNSHLIFITRDRDVLTSTPCLGDLGGANEIQLKGLDQKWASRLMAEMGMEPDEMDRVYGMTDGHPLALELVNSKEIEKIIDTDGLTKEEVWVVRCLKAFDAIF
jgi:hypothetical protein